MLPLFRLCRALLPASQHSQHSSPGVAACSLQHPKLRAERQQLRQAGIREPLVAVDI
jgi:hypothetical protein